MVEKNLNENNEVDDMHVKLDDIKNKVKEVDAKLKSKVQQLQFTSDKHKKYILIMTNKVTQNSKKIEFMWKGY